MDGSEGISHSNAKSLRGVTITSGALGASAMRASIAAGELGKEGQERHAVLTKT